MDDTEFFLPSEIARLVYGHFKAMESEDLSTKFLNESPHLSECRELKKRNRTFKTEANGLPLKEILDQYLNMNKLVLGTVNKLVGDHQKFTDPVEAFSYLLSDTSKEKQSCTNMGTENQDSLGSNANSDDEDFFSDFSLNLKTPEKHPSREKVTKNKLETVVELNNTLDRTVQETTPQTNKSPPISTTDTLIRHSTRLQLKNSLKNDRSCNSDSIKEMRLNPNDDCETPRKLGNPPYSENKLLKPKTPISLLSSDSEPETSLDNALSVVNTSSGSCAVTEKLNGLFSPERPKPVKKKTLKVMRPRRPPPAKLSSDEQSGDNEKIKCKRNRKTATNNSSTSDNENKKTKLSDVVDQLQKDIGDEERTQRSSDEFVFTTDGLQADDKQKTRRKSSSMLPVNKSLPKIDDTVLGEKLIKNKKLQEHIAANVNEVIMNSPQKKANESDTVDLDELIENTIEKILDDPLFEKFQSDLIMDSILGKGFIPGQASSDVNSVAEFTGNEINATPEIIDQPQINDQVTVEIEDPLMNTVEDVETHHEEQNPAIIIEIRQEQIENEENYIEKNTTVSEELRHYWSNITGLESSPDGKLNSMKPEHHASVINIMTSDGEISETCKITNDTSETMVLNNEPVLYSLNEGFPMVIHKGPEFRICGAPSTITKINRKQYQYVPIAPKRGDEIQSTDIATERKAPKRRRTRGGKRT